MKDVFAIQDEIATSIARALRVMLSEEEKRAIEKVQTIGLSKHFPEAEAEYRTPLSGADG